MVDWETECKAAWDQMKRLSADVSDMVEQREVWSEENKYLRAEYQRLLAEGGRVEVENLALVLERDNLLEENRSFLADNQQLRAALKLNKLNEY